MTDDIPGLGTALHERVRDEHPDLDRLISVSTRAGARLRRRRTAVVTLGCAAAVVAVVGIAGLPLGEGTAGSEPGPATQPSSSASESVQAGDLQRLDKRLATEGSVSGDEVQLGQLRGLGDETDTNGEPTRAQLLPVHVAKSLPGWQISTPADEKFSAAKGRQRISVNVRALSELNAWSGNDPDHSAGQITHVGDNYFVTVQPDRGVPQALVDELVDALRYQPVWKQ